MFAAYYDVMARMRWASLLVVCCYSYAMFCCPNLLRGEPERSTSCLVLRCRIGTLHRAVSLPLHVHRVISCTCYFEAIFGAHFCYCSCVTIVCPVILRRALNLGFVVNCVNPKHTLTRVSVLGPLCPCSSVMLAACYCISCDSAASLDTLPVVRKL